MSISIDEAEKLITPTIVEKLRSSIINAFNDYNELDASLRFTLCATTRANFINDRMCHHARNMMEKMNGIDFVKRRGRLHIIIIGEQDSLEVKFKKLDDNRRPSNPPTVASLEFMEQKFYQVQFEFPGMLHPLTNLITGYQLNETRTGIRGIFVVCPYGSQNKWEIEIPVTAVAPATLSSVLSRAEHELEPPRKRVVPKTKLTKKIS